MCVCMCVHAYMFVYAHTFPIYLCTCRYLMIIMMARLRTHCRRNDFVSSTLHSLVNWLFLLSFHSNICVIHTCVHFIIFDISDLCLNSWTPNIDGLICQNWMITITSSLSRTTAQGQIQFSPHLQQRRPSFLRWCHLLHSCWLPEHGRYCLTCDC